MNFRPKFSFVLIFSGVLCGLCGPVHAGLLRDSLMEIAQQDRMPLDQRREMRQQMREHWQQLPPEQRQELREQRRERREAYQVMPQEDRSRMRDELRGRREGWNGGERVPHGDGYGGRGRH